MTARALVGTESVLSKKEIGMLLFLAAEAMFFAGLISAYLVLRAQVVSWPPADQPRLPVLITGINSLVLILSGASLFYGFRSKIRFWSLVSIFLGALFLVIQGYEWVQLIRFGLATQQSVYAGTFYVLIGTHAAHVLAGLVLVASVVSCGLSHSLKMGLMYWLFVVGLWPILYALVYF